MGHPFEGIYPALLTPFTKSGAINADALKALIEWNIKKGVAGFYVGGSTAEAFLLTEEERNSVYKIASEAAEGRVKLIAHVGAISTEQAIRFGKVAKSLGYDAISAIAPFYYKISFEQIKKHYFDIVNAVEMPMIIYNFPNFSGVNLSVEQISQFFSDDRIIGLKHTSSDFFALEQFKTNFPGKILFNGFDEMLLCGLIVGADGGIGSTYNFMAEKFIAMQSFYNQNHFHEALKEQKEANRIIKVLCKVGVMEGEKGVLNQLGFDFGCARAPFSELTADQKKFLKKEITDKL